MKALKEGLPQSLDILAVQELTDTLKSHLSTGHRSTQLHDQQNESGGGIGTSGVDYGCGIYHDYPESKWNAVFHGTLNYHDTVMGRTIAFTVLQNGKHFVVFCSTHLESFVREYNGEVYHGIKERELQLSEGKAFIEEMCKIIGQFGGCEKVIGVVCGDMNWDDKPGPRGGKCKDKDMISLLDDKWKDAWISSKGNEDYGYTYDGKLNAMLQNSLRKRFDRVLIHDSSPSFGVTIESVTMTGTKVIPNLLHTKTGWGGKPGKEVPVMVSDHFGLFVELTIRKGESKEGREMMESACGDAKRRKVEHLLK